ncbi:MAG TPA: hypothetical protein VFP22_10815 [Candidatus Limnocylindrales bacterium]|nr:hypothetical protein [Candidatus Limnocylindrales bacterium]
MGVLIRARRAAAAALLLTSATGVAGTMAISGALAVDPPPTLALRGMIVDERGAALADLHLTVSEQQAPDGGLAGFTATTGPDGIFSVDLYAWGTDATPADVTIATAPNQRVKEVVDGCTRTYSAIVADHRLLVLEGAAHPPKPLDIVARTALIGEVCGAKGTPAPNSGGSGGSSGGSTHSSRPRVTPPATDARAALGAASTERLGPALVIGFVAGLVAALMLLVGPRRDATRRR